jgi:DNA polymerase-3 subunit gamma/tau
MTDSLFNIDELTTGAGDEDSPSSAAGTAGSAAGQSLSLYRKYRPQSFASDELFGQDHVVNTLRNAIRLDRIAHAYLFCGPRGTGKTTTARILAKAVNCLDPDPANRPCNQCEACRAINANATTDVIEIDAASNRGIDDIRDLRERVKYAPTMLKTKFYIIDEAHQITGAAANAFLKTLEEPPPHTRFVLATTDPEELLQTIVSRCQRFDFRRIGIEAMSARLRQVAGLEGIEIEDDALATIARHATGSLRDALGLLDQVAVYREEAGGEAGVVTAELVRAVLGVSRNDRVEGIVRAIADQDPGAGLNLINDAVDAGEDIRQLGRQLLGYLRILMLERASGSPDADDVARELARRFELSHLARIATQFADIDFKARHAAIVQLPLELALIQACSPASEVAPAQPAPPSEPAPAPERATPAAETEIETPRRPRRGPSLTDRVRGASMPRETAPPPSPTIEQAEPAPAQPPRGVAESEVEVERYAAVAAGTGGDLDLIVERWDNIRMDVKALNRRTEALLQQADPLVVEGTQLTLVAAYPFHQKRLNEDETRRVIEDVIERQIGKRITITCVSRDEAQVMRPAAAPASSTVAATRTTEPATPASPREPGTRARSDAATSDDDAEPASFIPDLGYDDDALEDDIASSPSSVSSLDLDEERIKAAINIFDAIIIDEND